jgi:hypothetical protein
MSGKASHVNSLEVRKQLLVAECELSRALLSEDWSTMVHGAGGMARRAGKVGAWASAAVVLAVGVTTLRRGPRAVGATMLRGLRLGSAVWLGFRGRGDRSA